MSEPLPKDAKLAIMKKVTIGVCDRGVAALMFHTFLSENEAAMQMLNWGEAKVAIEDSGVSDVRQLEGKPCWVREDHGLIIFIRMWKS